MGIEAFGESQVTIRARIKTLPLKQWEVGRELRRRVKLEFDRRGIEIPIPQRVLLVESLPIGPRREAATEDSGAGDRQPRPAAP
jgi:small conductance mechanosensitive channel